MLRAVLKYPNDSALAFRGLFRIHRVLYLTSKEMGMPPTPSYIPGLVWLFNRTGFLSLPERGYTWRGYEGRGTEAEDQASEVKVYP